MQEKVKLNDILQIVKRIFLALIPRKTVETVQAKFVCVLLELNNGHKDASAACYLQHLIVSDTVTNQNGTQIQQM